MRWELPTKRQRQILDIIRTAIRERGIVPTYAEIAQALGLKNRSIIQRQLKSLERQGLVELTGVGRGLRLLGEGTPLLDAGHLAAMKNGVATEGETCPDTPRLKDHEGLLEAFPARPDCFVRIDDGWLDTDGFAARDIVAVRTKPEPRDGDVVLARVGETPTLARFIRIDSRTAHLRAVGRDGKLKPVQVGRRTDEAKILGTLVGAIVGTGRTREG